MKDFIVLTAICIAVVVAVGWFLLPGSPADFFRPRVTVQAETPDPPDHPAADAGEEPHPEALSVRHERSDSARSPAASTLDAASKPPAAPAPAPSAASTNLPLPWDVLPGEQGSEVVDTYGAPSLATSTQDSGHLYETYVYRNSGTQAVVHLEDGRVSRVSMKDSLRPTRP